MKYKGNVVNKNNSHEFNFRKSIIWGLTNILCIFPDSRNQVWWPSVKNKRKAKKETKKGNRIIFVPNSSSVVYTRNYCTRPTTYQFEFAVICSDQTSTRCHTNRENYWLVHLCDRSKTCKLIFQIILNLAKLKWQSYEKLLFIFNGNTT